MKEMNEKTVYTEEKTAKEYEAYYKTKYRRADALEKKLLEKMLSQFNDISQVLEVGCGTGHFTKWMATLGLQCYGADVSKPMLQEAKNTWTQSCLVQCEATQLPFAAQSVDIVAFITSLEFIRDPQTALSEALRVAKKGLVIGLLNKFSLSTLTKQVKTTSGRSRHYQNAHFYAVKDIEQMLKQTQTKRKAMVWDTTVFPTVFGDLESSSLPFGAFLGIAVKVEHESNE
jgi:ubiquinone/menaquinone biosynthesis C-methylase UbiE